MFTRGRVRLCFETLQERIALTAGAHGELPLDVTTSGGVSTQYDVNGDGLVSIADILTLANFLVSNGPAEVANIAPDAADDFFRTYESTPAQGNLLHNDVDINCDTLEAYPFKDPENGTLLINTDGTFEYTPDPGFSGVDEFEYRVVDGLSTDYAVVTILVDGINPSFNIPPVAVTDEFTTIGRLSANVLGNDTDLNGDDLSATLETSPRSGEVTFNTDGTFSYIPDFGFRGNVGFQYRVSDGTDSDVGHVYIAVMAPPSFGPLDAVDDHYNAFENLTLEIPSFLHDGVLSNDTAISTPTAIVVSDPLHGTLQFQTNGAFNYTPDSGYTGLDSFVYRIISGVTVDDAVVTINVVENTIVTGQ